MSVYLPTGSLGLICKDFQKRLDETIADSIYKWPNADASLNIDLEAARHVNVGLANLKITCKDRKKISLEQTEGTIQKIIGEMTLMIQKIENRDINSLTSVKASVQQWINNLQFPNWKPCLKEITPGYIASNHERQGTITFKGNFLFAQNKDFEPSLELNGKKIAYVSATVKELTFNVNVEKASKNMNTYTTAVLRIPYEADSIKKIAKYKLWLGTLPIAPGRVTVYYTKEKINLPIKHITSAVINANTDDRFPERWIERPYTIYPDDGWYVVENSVEQPKIMGPTCGEHNHPSIAEIQPNVIVTQVSMAAYDIEKSTIVPHNVEFDQVQGPSIKPTRVEKISEDNIKWDHSFELDLQSDEELLKIVFESFDGSNYEFGRPSSSNPYLKIHLDQGKYRLEFKSPAEIP